MANWTPEGFTGKMFRLTSRYVPPPVEIPAPTLWGDQAVARLRLNANGVPVETKRRTVAFEYPLPPRDVVQFFREYFGPTRVAFSRLDDDRQSAYRDDLEKLCVEHNRANNGKTLIHNEYLRSDRHKAISLTDRIPPTVLDCGRSAVARLRAWPWCGSSFRPLRPHARAGPVKRSVLLPPHISSRSVGCAGPRICPATPGSP